MLSGVVPLAQAVQRTDDRLDSAKRRFTLLARLDAIQDEDGGTDAGIPQFDRLREARDGEVAGAGRRQSAADIGRTVPVGVGLDDAKQHGAGAGQFAQIRVVGTDGVQIDDGPAAHDP